MTGAEHRLPTAERLALRLERQPALGGITRTTRAEDVVRLRGTVRDRALARAPAAPRSCGAICTTKPFVNALGALTGNQAMQQVKAGLEAIYLSGWQVAADANLAGEMYPDQSLYPANSVPTVVKRINNTLLRADQIHHAEGNDAIDWLEPIVADAEAGFGGVLNAFELMKAMIEAGAAGVHFEDQLASREEVRPHGRQGAGADAGRDRQAGRRAPGRRRDGRADLLVARTDAEGANLLTADVDERDRPFIAPASAPSEGFFSVSAGLDAGDRARPGLRAVRRPGVVRDRRSPTSTRRAQFAEGIHAKFPGKLLAYNCSPSFNWKKNLDDAHDRQVPARARRRWATSSSSSRWPASTRSTTRCSSWRTATSAQQMSAYVELQQAEFAAEEHGYTAAKHQREVGTGYFDAVTQAVSGGNSSITALAGSTEEQQFEKVS